MDIFAHLCILRPKGRGIKPGEIEAGGYKIISGIVFLVAKLAYNCVWISIDWEYLDGLIQ